MTPEHHALLAGLRCDDADTCGHIVNAAGRHLATANHTRTGEDFVAAVDALLAENAALRAERDAAEAALQKDRTARRWYWLDDDPENTGSDPGEVLEYADVPVGEVVKLGIGREAGFVWATPVVLTRDEDGEPDDVQVRWFGTEAEALAAAASTP